MPTYIINQGENVLLQFHLLTMADGLTWKGVWDSATPYVVDDVVELDDVGYVAVAPNTNQTPPNTDYWYVLPAIDADDVKNCTAELRLSSDETETAAVRWKYKTNVPPQSNIRLADGLLELELTAEDSRKLSGSYDLHFDIAIKDGLFIASGAQTDSICLTNALNVLPCEGGSDVPVTAGFSVWDDEGIYAEGAFVFYAGSIWQATGSNTDSAPTITNSNWTHISGTIDLGLVSLRDAAIYGRARPLIPYADGRLIKSVRFVPGDTYSLNGYGLCFMTPNTGIGPGGVGALADLLNTFDTSGAVEKGVNVGLSGDENFTGQILDCGPLFVGLSDSGFLPFVTWQPNTEYALHDFLVDANGFGQFVSINGISGATIPAFNQTPYSTTSDGSVQWTNDDTLINGEVHTIVEVIEGVSPMPPYPATISFIAQPQNTVAGATMAAITVQVKDQNGDPYIFRAYRLLLEIIGVGTLSGTANLPINQTTGIATFDDLSISEVGTGYVMRARLDQSLTTDPIFSDPFDIT